jgi:microcystin-dependent protein
MPAVGAIVWRGASASSGYLPCDGSAVSRTTFSDLFAAIGEVFGAGNGTTTFNIPDLIDRHPIGEGGALALGDTGGAVDHTHTTAAHDHAVTQPANHANHSSAGGHTHNAHTTGGLRATGAQVGFDAPVTHAVQGAHTHDAHSAHTGMDAATAAPTTTSSEVAFLAFVPMVKT